MATDDNYQYSLTMTLIIETLSLGPRGKLYRLFLLDALLTNPPS